MHENTILKMGALEREYADEIGSLKDELEEEQTTKESLEETFSLELSRIKENHDRDLEVANDLKQKMINLCLLMTNSLSILSNSKWLYGY
jgi:serine phosphatase RsbU (regulator of sigma subunit)